MQVGEVRYDYFTVVFREGALQLWMFLFDLQRIAELCQERESSTAHITTLSGFGDEPPEGLAVQLADSKAKLRRLKQEL